MSYRAFRRAAVLGAGVMGSQIAAHLAGAGLEVDLLDLPDAAAAGMQPARGSRARDKSGGAGRSARAAVGLEWARKQTPPALALPEYAQRIRVGNFEDDLARLAEADWVIEAVVEDLAQKRELLAKVDEVRRAGAVVTTNTSGISIRAIAEGRSEGFQRHFLGTHFFNPPRYMYLLELIPTAETDRALVEEMEHFATIRLGKGVVRAKDTPLFVANRIGIFVRMCAIRTMIEDGYTIDEVDAVAGVPMARPRTGVFRLGDLVGLDTSANVVRYLYGAAPNDERRELFRLPEFIEELIRRGHVGDKAGQGYYRRAKGGAGGAAEVMTLDWRTMEYRPRVEFESPTLATAKEIRDPGERLAYLVSVDDRVGRFVWKTLGQSLIYAANRIPEIADSPAEIDRAVRWGFNWELGLFEMWDALGVEATVQRLERDGREVPETVVRMLSSGRKAFYEPLAEPPTCVNLATGGTVALEEPVKSVNLAALKKRGRGRAGADEWSLIEIGDGVACLELHAKGGVLGLEAAEALESAMEQAEREFRALVIGTQATHFSTGHDLARLLKIARDKDWKALDGRLQAACVAIGRAAIPVVAAPVGQTLGAGAEMVLRAHHVQAAMETYIGLVDIRAGLIPAAGGCVEMLRRAIARVPPEGDPWPLLKEVFDAISQAKVWTSAEEARRMGLLRATDGISLNRGRQLADAKQAAIRLAEAGGGAGARAGGGAEILALGADALARLRLGLHLAHQAGYATQYDVVLGGKLAWVLCGGDMRAPRLVPEQYLLDLEREAFLSLLGDDRTQARMEHLVKTGKPLRN